MRDRAEIQRLLLAAAGLPKDVRELAGKEGYNASLEPSRQGKARRVGVSHDGVEVCWTFSLESGEGRPPFYPDGVPYVGDLPSVLMWTRESGLSVKWMVPGFEDRIQEMVAGVGERDLASVPSEITELAERMVGATSEERRSLLARLVVEGGSPVGEWATNLFGEPTEGGLPRQAAEALQRIVEFHEESGWTVTRHESGGVPQRYELTKGQSVRRLFAMSLLGLTAIDLNEPGCGD